MLKRALGFLVLVTILLSLLVIGQLSRVPRRISGVIEADVIEVGSLVGGRVASVEVEEGDTVSPGDVLLRLEPYDLDARRDEADAAIAARRADLDRLEKGFRPEEIAAAQAQYEQAVASYKKLQAGPREQEIDVARRQLESAEAALTLAQRTFERFEALAQEGSAAKARLDQATEELDRARAMQAARQAELDLLLIGTRKEDLDAAAARVAEAKAAWALREKGYRDEEIAAARAALQAAEAARASLDKRFDELTVKTPSPGRVESMDLHEGDLVSPGAPVASVRLDNGLHVRAFVPEAIPLHVGQAVAVSIDAYPDRRFAGRVAFISTEAEFTPSNVQTPEERSKQVFRVKIQLDESGPPLRPGIYVDLRLDEAPTPTPHKGSKGEDAS